MTKIRYQDKKLGRPRKGVTYKKNSKVVIITKFPGYCAECFEDIAVGEWVTWNSDTKELNHKRCPPTSLP